MDQQLSPQEHNILEQVKLHADNGDQSTEKDTSLLENLPLSQDYALMFDSNELINIDKIQFYDDETWLYESTTQHSKTQDLKEWLYSRSDDLKNEDYHVNRMSLLRDVAQLDTKKKIDSRTFTRPKKRINRPNIEKYNEDYFGSEKKSPSMIQNYGDKLRNHILALASDDDDFIFNTTVNNAQSIDIPSVPIVGGNRVLDKPLSFDLSQPVNMSVFDKIVASAGELDSFQNMSPPSLVNSMCSSTFTNVMESSLINNDPILRQIRDDDLETLILQESGPVLFQSFTESCSSINSDTAETFVKRTLGDTFNAACYNDLYGKNETFFMAMNQTFNADDDTIEADFIENCSSCTVIGSSDSLDRSSLSTSSRGSNKRLNMAEVDAIVQLQEQSLQQVMSTPRHNIQPTIRLFDNVSMSPIKPKSLEQLSDSGSSNDDYMTVRSSLSKATLGSDSNLRYSKPNFNSLENLPTNRMETNTLNQHPRSLNTLTQRGVLNMKPPERNLKGSYPKLNTQTLYTNATANKGSYSNLYKGSYTNLKSFGNDTNLKTAASGFKGSVPNIKAVPNNTTITINTKSIPKSNAMSKPKVAEVGPTVRDSYLEQVKPVTSLLSNPLLKAQYRPSGLPRAVGGLTGIPRPVSRIPGPRAIRPVNPRPNLRPGSQPNIKGGYY